LLSVHVPATEGRQNEGGGQAGVQGVGYIDGKDARTHGRQVAKYPLADLDQYREGFLAGYSLLPERRCGASAWSGPEGSAERRPR
jgi:hypothetical protein